MGAGGETDGERRCLLTQLSLDRKCMLGQEEVGAWLHQSRDADHNPAFHFEAFMETLFFYKCLHP